MKQKLSLLRNDLSGKNMSTCTQTDRKRNKEQESAGASEIYIYIYRERCTQEYI